MKGRTGIPQLLKEDMSNKTNFPINFQKPNENTGN